MIENDKEFQSCGSRQALSADDCLIASNRYSRERALESVWEIGGFEQELPWSSTFPATCVAMHQVPRGGRALFACGKSAHLDTIQALC